MRSVPRNLRPDLPLSHDKAQARPLTLSHSSAWDICRGSS
jgi:hypothetical protein